MLARVHCRVLVVHLRNWWLARAAAAAQHYKLFYHILVAREKIKIRTPISTESVYHLYTAVQSKSLRLGTACNLLKPHRLWELPCSSAAASRAGTHTSG